MFNIGMQELIFIFLIIFLLFGGKALPDVARGLAQAIKLFKKELRDIGADVSAESSELKKDVDKKIEKNEIPHQPSSTQDVRS